MTFDRFTEIVLYGAIVYCVVVIVGLLVVVGINAPLVLLGILVTLAAITLAGYAVERFVNRKERANE